MIQVSSLLSITVQIILRAESLLAEYVNSSITTMSNDKSYTAFK